jgi:hypothetical protein
MLVTCFACHSHVKVDARSASATDNKPTLRGFDLPYRDFRPATCRRYSRTTGNSKIVSANRYSRSPSAAPMPPSVHPIDASKPANIYRGDSTSTATLPQTGYPVPDKLGVVLQGHLLGVLQKLAATSPVTELTRAKNECTRVSSTSASVPTLAPTPHPP